jgi:hypothetical protein
MLGVNSHIGTDADASSRSRIYGVSGHPKVVRGESPNVSVRDAATTALQKKYGGPPMSPNEAAKWLGFSGKRVRAMIANGEFPEDLVQVTEGDAGVKRYRIYPKAIEVWNASHQAA